MAERKCPIPPLWAWFQPVLVVSVLPDGLIRSLPRSDSWQWVNRSDVWPPGRSRASACQRSRVLFSTCRRKCLWGSCRSRSDGGTGSPCGRLTASTTTWTPNWKAPRVSEERRNYGNCTLWMCQRFGVFVCPPLQNLPFVPLLRESSRRRGHVALSSLFGAESAFCLGARSHSAFSPLVAAAHSSASSSLRTWRRCSWWSGGRWRRTCRGWRPTTPPNDAVPQDKLSRGNFFGNQTTFCFEFLFYFFWLFVLNKHLISEITSGNAPDCNSHTNTNELPKRRRNRCFTAEMKDSLWL